jgi:hypothetical protein
MTFNLCNIYHHLEMHFHLIMYAFYVPFYMCRSLHIRTYVLFSPNPRLRIFEESHGQCRLCWKLLPAPPPPSPLT